MQTASVRGRFLLAVSRSALAGSLVKKKSVPVMIYMLRGSINRRLLRNAQETRPGRENGERDDFIKRRRIGRQTGENSTFN
jgi:hypothetical protein